MGARASRSPGGDSATVVISQRVRAGRVDDYKRWQEKTNQVARSFEGFESDELYPPASDEENEWVEVFRFSHIHQLTAWLGSDARQRLLDEGNALLEGPPTQEVLTGGAPAQDAVTAVVSHEVRPGREQDFARWQDKMLKAQEKFPGFMGSELFKPVRGLQDRWVVVFRFDTRAHLEEWLASDLRRKLLDEGRDCFVSYDVRKIGSSFGGWFRFGAGAAREMPPNWKQAMSVLLALYPTVMVLNLTLGPALVRFGVAGYLGLFISNICSVAILTWILMPLVNRGLAFWLLPERARSARVHVAGAALVAVFYGVLLLIFALTT
ncbi:antibiotic biosynthesis monooxygenase [Streptantibioticus rubrisoli]|uniref:Antibiotic biosynthesis monooxygenase n=1 Tax=Streptantibioticus rubrisoli TaxID=1387313 RepID=A0ABT1PDR3_9ACTN|nr:antibiotic biosynthesis monooxygenase [Streptantibioticus rubrisoli]MCQ4042603.1 antibiotic biosynthesis monooxygenase [Streptantibioticus rubrisoli]